MKRVECLGPIHRVLGLVAVVGLMGCTSTHQARTATPSGFLGDYSQLREGREGEALLVYIDPRVDFRNYDKVMIDPVRIYATQNSALAKLPRADLQRLVNYLDATLRDSLKLDYKVVTTPGPGVMRLRVAITEARAANVVLDIVSSVLPVSLALSEVKNIATGSHSAVGSVGAECEGLDSQTGTRLFAAVDARVGQKFTGKGDKLEKWRTAEDAFDYWGKRLEARLAAARKQGGTGR